MQPASPTLSNLICMPKKKAPHWCCAACTERLMCVCGSKEIKTKNEGFKVWQWQKSQNVKRKNLLYSVCNNITWHVYKSCSVAQRLNVTKLSTSLFCFVKHAMFFRYFIEYLWQRKTRILKKTLKVSAEKYVYIENILYRYFMLRFGTDSTWN